MLWASPFLLPTRRNQHARIHVRRPAARAPRAGAAPGGGPGRAGAAQGPRPGQEAVRDDAAGVPQDDRVAQSANPAAGVATIGSAGPLTSRRGAARGADATG